MVERKKFDWEDLAPGLAHRAASLLRHAATRRQITDCSVLAAGLDFTIGLLKPTGDLYDFAYKLRFIRQ